MRVRDACPCSPVKLLLTRIIADGIHVDMDRLKKGEVK